jgi:hypothetical protein
MAAAIKTLPSADEATLCHRLVGDDERFQEAPAFVET